MVESFTKLEYIFLFTFCKNIYIQIVILLNAALFDM